jgi:hypothetical protein
MYIVLRPDCQHGMAVWRAELRRTDHRLVAATMTLSEQGARDWINREINRRATKLKH